VLKFFSKNPSEFNGDLEILFVNQPETGKPRCPDDLVEDVMRRAIAAGDFIAKEGQTLLVYPESVTKNTKRVRRVLLFGLGLQKDRSRDLFRRAGGVIAQTALKVKAEKILLVLPEDIGLALDEATECLGEGVILGAYQFRKYKTKDDPDDTPAMLREIFFSATKEPAAVRRGIKRGEVAASAVVQARDMANEPGNFWNPNHFAEFGRKLGDRYGLKVRVLGLPEIKRLKMGGLLGVNQGSALPPTLTIMEYRCGKKVPVLLLVGKGLTFDSGGISIKPGSGMHEMKYDMCGGAAVLAVMQAVGEERPNNLDVIAIVPATENMPGPAALKPGDIICQYGGKTVEVENTDAEGRLILADALAYGVEFYKPHAVVDLATLTGAVIISLGHHHTGLMSNNDNLTEQVIAAGTRCDEPLWRLPLGPEYSKQLKSAIADLKNVGSRAAGSITAAAFLQEFVGKTPWVHLDIAGTAWEFTEKSYMPKGPSGVGVRTLLELIRVFKAPVESENLDR